VDRRSGCELRCCFAQFRSCDVSRRAAAGAADQSGNTLRAGDLSRAAATFEDATSAAETLINEATTTNGRLERIWQLRDSTGFLAFCRLKNGDFASAIEALERGKTLLWTAANAR
jgi:hypothetical protein